MCITLKELKQNLQYNPDTGLFVWVINKKNVIKGSIAGRVLNTGYCQIYVCGKHYYTHRLAWFYMTGEWPKETIDHKDLNKQNNKWYNLREASKSNNQHNKTKQINNTSGFKGIDFQKSSGLWRASIGINKKRLHLGIYDCKAAAHFAYIIAANTYHNKFALS